MEKNSKEMPLASQPSGENYASRLKKAFNNPEVLKKPGNSALRDLLVREKVAQRHGCQ